ncbi:MAG TPA: hypothetical protein VF522_15465 [Ramlibacter sp.]|uniref:hypothetical protein n=1 Tax=Ramlibacter sp. TaxID=1917967 RepID=UPI002ED109EF
MFTISTEPGPGYLRFLVAGPAGVHETCAGAAFCAELLRRTSSRRVLLDMMTFAPVFARADGLDVLSTLYGEMPALERLAVLIPAGKSHGIVLEVARHRNVPAREFDDPEEAAAWLTETVPLER